MLVAVVIVVGAAAWYFGSGGTATPSTVKQNSSLLDTKSQKNTVFGKAIDTGKATDCSERLRQIRMGIEQYKATGANEQNPPTLKDIGLGVNPDYFQCPVSNKPYTYDPATGTVHCPTHTNF